MDRTVNAFVKKLQEKDLRISFAESMTCGLAASKLATGQGTSDILAGSIVCYSPEVKRKLFGISKSTIDKFSCESQEITDLLAKRLPKLIHSDIHAAVTGLAADGGSEEPGKPVGTTFFTVIHRKKLHQKRKVFRGTPLEIREKACTELYRMILKIIG